MNKKIKLGKVIDQYNGYNLRIILESKTSDKTSRDGKSVRITSMCDSGKIGVYAGPKKLIKGDLRSKEEAKEYIDILISKKK